MIGEISFFHFLNAERRLCYFSPQISTNIFTMNDAAGPNKDSCYYEILDR